MSPTRPALHPITYRHVPHVIDVNDADRFDHWCRTLGVTRNQLIAAVSTVGANPDLVRRHLKQRVFVA